MKKIFLIAAVSALAACEDINKGGEERPNPEIEVVFTSVLNDYSAASGAPVDWPSNATAGIFMKKNGEELTQQSLLNGADNRKFLVAADGSFQPADENQSFCYVQDGSKVDFIAYTPYIVALSSYIFAMDASSAAPPNASLRYSNNATGKYKGRSAVSLKFFPVYTKLTLSISVGTGVSEESLADFEVSLEGTYPAGDFSIATGLVTYTGSKAAIAIPTTDQGTKGETLVLPTASLPAAGRCLQFTSPALDFTYTFADTFEFKQGKKYSADVVISISGISVTFQQIEDWEVEEESGSAN